MYVGRNVKVKSQVSQTLSSAGAHPYSQLLASRLVSRIWCTRTEEHSNKRPSLPPSLRIWGKNKLNKRPPLIRAVFPMRRLFEEFRITKNLLQSNFSSSCFKKQLELADSNQGRDRSDLWSSEGNTSKAIVECQKRMVTIKRRLFWLLETFCTVKNLLLNYEKWFYLTSNLKISAPREARKILIINAAALIWVKPVVLGTISTPSKRGTDFYNCNSQRWFYRPYNNSKFFFTLVAETLPHWNWRSLFLMALRTVVDRGTGCRNHQLSHFRL